MRTLIIAEKGTLAQAIADGLGSQQDPFKKGNGLWYQASSQTTIVAAAGHMSELVEPDDYLPSVQKTSKGKSIWRRADLPIIPNPWKQRIQDQKKDSVMRIKQQIEQHDRVIHAGDPDREGQAIVDDLIAFAKFKGTIDRAWIQDVSPKGIQKAFSSLKSNQEYIAFGRAQKARSQADWLVGMNMTRLLTLTAKQLIRVGRVKTTVCMILVQREREIAQFVPKDYYIPMVQVVFEGSTPFWVQWVPPESCDLLDEHGRLTSLDDAKRILESALGSPFEVRSYQKKEGKKEAPIPFSLTTLTKQAAHWGSSAQETLETAQMLYLDKKAQSYPRTSSGYLPEEQFILAKDVIESLRQHIPESWFAGVDLSRKHEAWDDKKVSAHYGIIPTGLCPTGLNDTQRKMYEAVVKRYLALFYPPYRYETQTIVLHGGGFQWKATAHRPLEQGWKVLYAKEDGVLDDEEEAATALPVLRQGDIGLGQKTNVESKRTTPPPRFTDSSLIDFMENIQSSIKDAHIKSILKKTAGIGTDATRAAVIKELIDSGLAELNKKKQIVPTESCVRLIEALEHVDSPLINVAMTAHWEEQLKDIEEGVLSLSDFMSQVTQKLRAWIELPIQWPGVKPSRPEIEQTMECSCPKCQKPMKRIQGKNGIFWSCTGYPDCKTTMNDKDGVPVAREESAMTAKSSAPVVYWPNFKCTLEVGSSVCGGKMIQRKTKTGKEYAQCERCKRSAWVQQNGTLGTYWPPRDTP